MSFFTNPGKYLREVLENQRERQHQRARNRRVARRQRRRLVTDQINHDNQEQSSITISTQPNSVAHAEVDNKNNIKSPISTQKSSISNIFDSVFSRQDVEDIEYKNLRNTESISIADDPRLNATTIAESLLNAETNPPEDDENKGDSKTLKHKISVIDLPFGLPENIPSEPLSSDGKCCCEPFTCNRYQVSYKLRKNYYRQSLFMKRVMIFLQTQLVVLQLLTLIVKWVPGLANFVTDDNFVYSYIPLVIFFVSKIALRSMVRLRKLRKSALILIAIVRTLCIAYYCTAITLDAQTDIINLTEIQLSLTILFFILTPFFVEYDVANSEIIMMGAVVNLIVSLAVFMIFLTVKINKINFGNFYSILVKNWMPSFFASEIIIIVVLFDLKQIMSGWRFPLGEADWMYTCLYL